MEQSYMENRLEIFMQSIEIKLQEMEKRLYSTEGRQALNPGPLEELVESQSSERSLARKSVGGQKNPYNQAGIIASKKKAAGPLEVILGKEEVVEEVSVEVGEGFPPQLRRSARLRNLLPKNYGPIRGINRADEFLQWGSNPCDTTESIKQTVPLQSVPNQLRELEGRDKIRLDV